LNEFLERRLDYATYVAMFVDAKAISTTFGSYAVVQRCQVHKMANVLQHFSESERKQWKQRLAELFACEDYNEATSIADQIDADLRKVNVSIARFFSEGLN